MSDDTKRADILPFGKYKGRSVSEVAAVDSAYLEWLTTQPWFKEKFAVTFNVMVNNVLPEKSQASPEHNELQAKFLDPAYCDQLFARDLDAAIRHYDRYPRYLASEEQKLRTVKRAEDVVARHNAWANKKAEWTLEVSDALPAPPRWHWNVEFEVGGVDVVIKPALLYDLWDVKEQLDGDQPRVIVFCSKRSVPWDTINIEIKPAVGDDYPAILRQMKKNKSQVLAYRRFETSTVSLEQVRAIFAKSGFAMVQLP